MKLKNKLLLTTVGLASLFLFTACSTGQTSNSKGQKVETITVATSADSNPYNYVVNGQLTGFEIDILKEADKNLPQYQFKFQEMDDSSILLALDGGRAQIAANNFGKTKAREAKYLFSYPIAQGINAIFSSSKENLKTIASLPGHSTEIPTGTNYGDILTQWNTQNPKKQITINYSQRALSDRLASVASGQVGFLFASKAAAENLVKEHQITGIVDYIPTDLDKYPSFKTYEYFVLDNSQTTLQKALNAQIKKMAEDGTLKKLSEKYFGDDQVPEMSLYN